VTNGDLLNWGLGTGDWGLGNLTKLGNQKILGFGFICLSQSFIR
jgi:hypothetical protein